jgi:hypothetical protein
MTEIAGALKMETMTKPDDYFLQKQLELMMDMNNKRVNAEITKMNETITRLNDEVRDLRRQMGSGARRVESAVPIVNASSGEVVNRPDAPERPVFTPKPEEPKQTSPRMGNYQTDDVSIDKFFYFGRR